MKEFRQIGALGLVMLVLMSVPAQAQNGPPAVRRGPFGGPGGPGGPPDPVLGMAGRALHDLDLSRDQRSRIHDIVLRHIEGGLGSLARAFLEARRDLEARLWDPDSTEADISAASALVAERAAALEKGRRPLALEVLGVLTETQRETFREMLAHAPEPPPGPPGPGR